MQLHCLALLLSPAVFLGGSPQPRVAPVTEPTNVIVILVDDLGVDQLLAYDDVNHYTSPYPYAFTPNIDYLASIGVRFRQARATPLCSPTRAALQTGRYGRRTGCGFIVNPQTVTASFCELNRSAASTYTPLGDALDPFGYAAGMFGKVHLHLDECQSCPGGGNGTGDGFAVSDLGFDRYDGILRNPDSDPPGPHACDFGAPGQTNRDHPYTYYHHVSAVPGLAPLRQLVSGCPGGSPSSTVPCSELACPGDCTSGCTLEQCYNGTHATRKQRLALENWVQSVEEPFFALLCTNDLHGPYDWPPAAVDPTVEGHHHGAAEPPVDHRNRRLRAKLEHLDSSIGLLLQSIDLETTTVILLADNGTQGGHGIEDVKPDEVAYPKGHPLYPFGQPSYSMAPYETDHLKGTPYEGGVRVPLIVAGKAVEGDPRVSDALVDVVDVYETLLELAQGASYVAPVTCSQVSVPGCTDSISFACILADTCDASSHARQFSYSALFRPNSYPPAPTADTVREHYIRRAPNGRLWKIVRTYPNGTRVDEFYDLVTNPLETIDLTSSHPAYAATVTELDARFPPFF